MIYNFYFQEAHEQSSVKLLPLCVCVSSYSKIFLGPLEVRCWHKSTEHKVENPQLDVNMEATNGIIPDEKPTLGTDQINPTLSVSFYLVKIQEFSIITTKVLLTVKVFLE